MTGFFTLLDPIKTMNKVIWGDALHALKRLDDNSVDLLCTDPPYGYSFMGKDWDKAVPSVEIWKECLRVLKPGAFAFIMSAPRQDVLSQMIVRIGEAGFDTDFTSIYWTYASGFPKAANIGKMVDKRLGAEREVVGRSDNGNGQGWVRDGLAGFKPTYDITKPLSPQAKALDGSYGGFQPKPAVEVIIVAMKPLSEKTFVDQALKNGKGVTWLDDARIPINDETGVWGTSNATANPTFNGSATKHEYRSKQHDDGRFPANLLVSDDVLNDGVERASGIKDTAKAYNNSSDIAYSPRGEAPSTCYADSGSYSRFFDLDAWWAKTFPFLIVPKASKGEKNTGLGDTEGRYMDGGRNVGSAGGTNPRNRGAESKRQNFHPTIKPLK